MKKLLFDSLRRQLMVGMTLVIVSMMALFVWNMTSRQQDEAIKSHTQQVTALAEGVATSSAVWVASRDYSGLQEIVSDIARYPNLSYIMVLDYRGQVLAHSDPSKIGLYLTDLPQRHEQTALQRTANLVEIITPITLAGSYIGWVRLGLDRTHFQQELAQTRQYGLVFSLGGILLSLLIAFVASRYLTRRLSAIQQVADSVKDGQTVARVVLSGDDEAARLGRQFNDMLDSLDQRESQLRSFYEFDIVGLTITSPEKGWLRINKSLCDMLEYSEQELRGMTWAELTHPDDLPADVEQFNKLLANEIEGYSLEKRFISKTGKIIPTLLVVRCVRRSNGEVDYVTAMVQDITERKQAEEALQRERNFANNLIETAQAVILVLDTKGCIVRYNPYLENLSGYPLAEMRGKSWIENFLPEHEQRRIRTLLEQASSGTQTRGNINALLTRNGEERLIEWFDKSLVDEDGNIIGLLAVGQDITERKQHEQHIEYIAHHDTLTTLPNRVLLADRMKQAIAQTSREQNMMAVCYLDLDGFKPVNDVFGHEAGDEVLVEIANRIGKTIRGGDTVARIGGDEFVILLLGLDKGEECMAYLERLLERISQPITVKGKPQTVSASIGVSIYPLDDDDADILLRHADQAMYVAKQSGKNRFHIYDPELDRRARSQTEFLKTIRHGLDQNQFELYYQPKVNLRTKELVGVEALIRWRHPERGLLSPAEFLSYTENTDMDIAIGEWVTATALAQMDSWRSIGLDIEVSINISGYHLESSGFLETLGRQLAIYPGMLPGRLQIEVLETVALNDIAVVRGIIESCSKIGVGFALDDFGTGYSSLSYLNGLPVETLKIDQSFVRDMLVDKGDMAIVQGIIALARAFERKTVAEGIETEEHYQMLLNMGCELGQGYGIARPMQANELTNWKVS